MNNEEEAGELEATYPANARLVSVRFSPGLLQAAIEPGGDRSVPCQQVLSLHGARIRRESTNIRSGKSGGGGGGAMKVVGSLALTAVTGIPIGLGGRPKTKEAPSTTKTDFQYALGLRVVGVEALWFLINTSFNFRQALGAEAGYAAEVNLRAFVRKLAEACPEARRDDFFTAIVQGTAAPEPLDSLMEFFRLSLAG